jgi:hypothetical protein
LPFGGGSEDTNAEMPRCNDFFAACETGKGWEACKIYCTPNATFAAQAEPLAEIKIADPIRPVPPMIRMRIGLVLRPPFPVTQAADQLL